MTKRNYIGKSESYWTQKGMQHELQKKFGSENFGTKHEKRENTLSSIKSFLRDKKVIDRGIMGKVFA